MAETGNVYKYTVLRMIATNDPKFPTCWVVVNIDVLGRTPLDAEKAMAALHGAGTYSAVSRWVPTSLKPVTSFVVDDEPVPPAPAGSGEPNE